MAPARTAVVHEGKALTYADLQGRITRLAHGLYDLGVRRGDRVAYAGPNHPAFLETLFAAGTLGAIFVPLNTQLARPELAYVLRDAGSAVLVYDAFLAASVDPLRHEAVPVRHWIRVGGGHEDPSDGAIAYEECIAGAAAHPVDEPVALCDPSIIMYTSGTTGRPKGATLSHANVTWNCFNVLVDVDVASDEVCLVSAPLFHAAALNMLCLPTLMKGGTAVLVGSFDVERTFDLILAHRVTWMFGVPAMFSALANSPRWQGADLSSLRVLLCGGAPVSEALIRTYERRGLVFLQGYGMTETAPGALFLGRHMAHKIGSAGKASFFTDVRLVRPDLAPPATGEPGEIIVTGPNVMSGYWGKPEETESAMLDGKWFRSGDVGVVDDEGYFFIRDRIKDMIISGGENIYPAEVESVLCQHAAVSECAVIGVPDEKWGEVGKAFVVLKPEAQAGEGALLGFLLGKIAKFKIPKSVVFVDALPHTGTGKVDKSMLRGGRAR